MGTVKRIKPTTRFHVDRCQQGMDGMNLEYKLNIEGAEKLYLPREAVTNDKGIIIAEIGSIGGKLSASTTRCFMPPENW